MASYTATSAKHATLVAATVDTVTLSQPATRVEVLHKGTTTDPIYFTVSGTAPTVAGDDTFVVLPGTAVQIDRGDYDGTDAVKLISAGANAYAVTA